MMVNISVFEKHLNCCLHLHRLELIRRIINNIIQDKVNILYSIFTYYIYISCKRFFSEDTSYKQLIVRVLVFI